MANDECFKPNKDIKSAWLADGHKYSYDKYEINFSPLLTLYSEVSIENKVTNLHLILLDESSFKCKLTANIDDSNLLNSLAILFNYVTMRQGHYTYLTEDSEKLYINLIEKVLEHTINVAKGIEDDFSSSSSALKNINIKKIINQALDSFSERDYLMSSVTAIVGRNILEEVGKLNDVTSELARKGIKILDVEKLKTREKDARFLMKNAVKIWNLTEEHMMINNFLSISELIPVLLAQVNILSLCTASCTTERQFTMEDAIVNRIMCVLDYYCMAETIIDRKVSFNYSRLLKRAFNYDELNKMYMRAYGLKGMKLTKDHKGNVKEVNSLRKPRRVCAWPVTIKSTEDSCANAPTSKNRGTLGNPRLVPLYILENVAKRVPRNSYPLANEVIRAFWIKKYSSFNTNESPVTTNTPIGWVWYYLGLKEWFLTLIGVRLLTTAIYNTDILDTPDSDVITPRQLAYGLNFMAVLVMAIDNNLDNISCLSQAFNALAPLLDPISAKLKNKETATLLPPNKDTLNEFLKSDFVIQLLRRLTKKKEDK